MRLNTKSEDLYMITSMAYIKHMSMKMKITGKISKKVEKKWEKRMLKVRCECNCNYRNKKCKWLPSGVFKHRLGSTWFSLFVWECRACHSTTTSVYDEEISEPLQKAYFNHVLTHRWE